MRAPGSAFLIALGVVVIVPTPAMACSPIDIDASVKHAAMIADVYWIGCIALCVVCLGINETRANRSVAIRALCLILPLFHAKFIFSAAEYTMDCSFPLVNGAIASVLLAGVLASWTGYRAAQEAWQRL